MANFEQTLPVAGHEGGIVAELRLKRTAPAVLKTKLAVIRSNNAIVPIIAIEGPEDKTVYYHWLKEIAPDLSYEMIVCNGKAKVFELRDLLQRDKTGLEKSVFFFVDHDFDGMRGNKLDKDVYITESYSIENHLVSEKTLDQLLKIEFHCEGNAGARNNVLEKFKDLYRQFLEATKELNKRIFVAKNIPIINLKPLPKTFNPIATIEENCIKPSSLALSDIVPLQREPTQEEYELHSKKFVELNPFMQYRGKFAMAFFSKFLKVLGEDRGKPDSIYFSALLPQPANGQISLDAIASKSSAPASFRCYVRANLIFK